LPTRSARSRRRRTAPRRSTPSAAARSLSGSGTLAARALHRVLDTRGHRTESVQLLHSRAVRHRQRSGICRDERPKLDGCSTQPWLLNCRYRGQEREAL
jgi:hypothetical protein